MADLRLYLALGVSILLIAGGGVGMYLFFGWVGVVLYLVLTFATLGAIQYFSGGGVTGGGGGPAPRRRQSKGARGRGSRDDR